MTTTLTEWQSKQQVRNFVKKANGLISETSRNARIGYIQSSEGFTFDEGRDNYTIIDYRQRTNASFSSAVRESFLFRRQERLEQLLQQLDEAGWETFVYPTVNGTISYIAARKLRKA